MKVRVVTSATKKRLVPSQHGMIMQSTRVKNCLEDDQLQLTLKNKIKYPIQFAICILT